MSSRQIHTTGKSRHLLFPIHRLPVVQQQGESEQREERDVDTDPVVGTNLRIDQKIEYGSQSAYRAK